MSRSQPSCWCLQSRPEACPGRRSCQAGLQAAPTAAATAASRPTVRAPPESARRRPSVRWCTQGTARRPRRVPTRASCGRASGGVGRRASGRWRAVAGAVPPADHECGALPAAAQARLVAPPCLAVGVLLASQRRAVDLGEEVVDHLVGEAVRADHLEPQLGAHEVLCQWRCLTSLCEGRCAGDGRARAPAGPRCACGRSGRRRETL